MPLTLGRLDFLSLEANGNPVIRIDEHVDIRYV